MRSKTKADGLDTVEDETQSLKKKSRKEILAKKTDKGVGAVVMAAESEELVANLEASKLSLAVDELEAEIAGFDVLILQDQKKKDADYDAKKKRKL